MRKSESLFDLCDSDISLSFISIIIINIVMQNGCYLVTGLSPETVSEQHLVSHV